ncbi:MAG TPA: methyltransferase [Caldimonas sp.]|nr:methyltransferase [Caldimonas sp.]
MSVDVAEQFGPGGWQFTPAVAEVFGEHVRASVPHYDLIQQMIAEASDWLVPAGGRVADLGAATGVTCCAIEQRHADRDIGFDLYDESPAMLKRAELALRELRANVRVLTHECRVEQGPLTHVGADLTVCLFTLQFLPCAADRVRALSLAREHAAPGGALIVAEKVRPRDVRWAEIALDASHDWKAAHGVSDAAIRAKARALRGVLIPSTSEQLARMIRRAGWSAPEPLFRWHQWVMLGAFNG